MSFVFFQGRSLKTFCLIKRYHKTGNQTIFHHFIVNNHAVVACEVEVFWGGTSQGGFRCDSLACLVQIHHRLVGESLWIKQERPCSRLLTAGRGLLFFSGISCLQCCPSNPNPNPFCLFLVLRKMLKSDANDRLAIGSKYFEEPRCFRAASVSRYQFSSGKRVLSGAAFQQL